MRLRTSPVVVTVSALALVLFHLHITSAQTTALGSLAASMQPGTWAELQTNNLNSTFSSSDMGGGASGQIIGYTDDAVWDPVSRQVFFLGGDHNWSVPTTAKFVSYSEATNSWQKRAALSWASGVVHGYHHSAIDPAAGIFYHRPFNERVVHRYNIAAQTWDQPPMANLPFTSDYNNCCDALEYFPELGGLVWVSGSGSVYLYRNSTNQWSTLARNLGIGGTWHSAKYNPVYKVLIFYSEQTGALYKLSSSGQVTRLANPPIALYDGGLVGPLTVDPVSGKYLTLRPNNGQLYTYDVQTDVWQAQSSPTKPNFDSFVVAAPISTYGVNLFVSCSDRATCRVFLYKHSGGSPAPTNTTFSLSNGGDVTAMQGQSASDTVMASLVSGTGASVSFAASGLPAGATASFSPASCVLACTSTLTISTSASTPTGSSTVTVSGIAGSVSHTTSLTLTVSAPSSSSSSFEQKCAQSGVVNCFSFDSPANLFYAWPAGTQCDAALAGQSNYGFGLDRKGPGNTVAVVQNGQCFYPQIDTSNPHSGAGALKITIPSKSGADSGGYFSEPFKRNPDGTFPYIGPGSPSGNVVYFQFYQKFDSNFLNTDFRCTDGTCSGWKQAIWYGNPPNGSSSSLVESTMINGWLRGVPQMYGQQGHDDYGIEDVAGCTYGKATGQGGSGSGFNSRANYSAPLNAACAHYPANQWTEFTGRLEIRGASNAPSSRVQLWVDGRLMIDYGAARVDWSGSDGNGFGQFLLSPYHTNKDPNQDHPVGYTWYDDVIISTQPIAMSGGSTPTPPNVDTTPPSITNITVSGITSSAVTVAWTSNEPADSQVEYGVSTSYGSQSSLDNALVMSHSQTISGLMAGATYNYRVKSRDAAGNLATSSNVTFTTASGGSAGGSTPPVAGLIGYWKFDEGTGSAAADSSGANNHGSLSHGPIWTAGRVGGALQFNATDNGDDSDDPRVVIGRNFDIASVPFTLSAWVNPVDFADYRAILSKRDSYAVADMRLDWGLKKSSGTVYIGRSGSLVEFAYAPQVNMWTHLAVVATSTDTTLYVNGVLQQTAGVSSLGTDAAANTVIGGTGEPAGGDNDPFKGKIDEVRAYNRALSTSEIQDVFNFTGNPLPVPAGPTTTFSIPQGGGQAWLTTATTDSIQVGYARVQPDTGTSHPSGVAIFGFRTGGILVSEAGVPASAAVQSGRVYCDVNGPVNTGIALANPSNQDAVLSFYFTDMAGNDFGQGSFTLNAANQISVFLNQAPFNGRPSMQGTFTFSSSVPVGVIAVRGFTNERGEFLITTLPVAPIPDTGTNATLLPHFAAGAGWTTQVILTNPSDNPLTGTLQFFGPGSPSQAAAVLNVLVNGAANSTFSYTIPARAAVRLVVENSDRTTIQVGSVRITPSGNIAPVALAVFSYKNNGITVSEAGVSALPTGTAFRMYAETSGALSQIGSIQTAVAIANPSSAPVAVTLELTLLDGSTVAVPFTATVPAGGQIARFIKEMFPALPATFRGFLKVTSTGPIGMTGIRGRYNERNDFLTTTTPPSNEGLVSPETELVFPQIVSGGGYSTQFIIFGQSGSGRLWLNSREGTPLPPETLQRIQ